MSPRQRRRRPSSRSTPRRRSCPTTTTISARPTRCPSSTTSPAPGSAILRRDGELGRDLHLRIRMLLDDPAITTEGAAPGDLQRRSARNGAPMVRRPRHHGVVGRPVAERRLRQLDGEQDHPAFPSRMGRRRRPRRRRAKGRWASTRSNRPTRSCSRSAPSSRRTRRSTRSLTRRASRSSRCSRISPAPDVWREGIRRYIAAHAYQNTRTTDLWAAQEAAGATACRSSPATSRPSRAFPLITVGPAQCVGGSDRGDR